MRDGTILPASAIRYLAVGASDALGEGASEPATKNWPALLHDHPGRVFVGNAPDLTRVPYYAAEAPRASRRA